MHFEKDVILAVELIIENQEMIQNEVLIHQIEDYETTRKNT